MHEFFRIIRYLPLGTGNMQRHYCWKKYRQNLRQETSTGFGNLKSYTLGDFNLNTPLLWGELLAKLLQSGSSTEKIKGQTKTVLHGLQRKMDSKLGVSAATCAELALLLGQAVSFSISQK